MEILIFGVILVAFMVFISTKIKKSAASAFEREIIDREDFRIIKPEGFINPINEQSEFVFEAYSKEHGKNDADEFNQSWANLTVFSNSTFEATIKNIRKTAGKISSEKISANAPEEQKICLIESEEMEKSIPVKKFYKIVESAKQRKIYQLQISVLDAYQNDYAIRINEMLESFFVK